METLKIEAGKYYRTSRGERALVLHRTEGEADTLPIIGIIGDRVVRWHTDGGNDHVAYSTYLRGSHDDDLVAEWVEPKRIKGFLSIYPHNEQVYFHRTREEALRSGMNGYGKFVPVALVEIDVLEGNGLEGVERS